MNLSFVLNKNKKVENYTRINNHKFITLRFWFESSLNILCGWT